MEGMKAVYVNVFRDVSLPTLTSSLAFDKMKEWLSSYDNLKKDSYAVATSVDRKGDGFDSTVGISTPGLMMLSLASMDDTMPDVAGITFKMVFDSCDYVNTFPFIIYYEMTLDDLKKGKINCDVKIIDFKNKKISGVNTNPSKILKKYEGDLKFMDTYKMSPDNGTTWKLDELEQMYDIKATDEYKKLYSEEVIKTNNNVKHEDLLDKCSLDTLYQMTPGDKNKTWAGLAYTEGLRRFIKK